MAELWAVMVPVTQPNGERFPEEYHREWDRKVIEISKGMTLFQTAKGTWVSPEGEVFKEPMIPVMMICTKEQVDKIVDFTGMYYNQKAVMYFRVSDFVDIRHFKE
jgi:hypothetical protein